jgi:ATP-dependent DNA ligase
MVKKPFAGMSVPLSTPPMEAKLVSELPRGRGWQFEPKWDGFRCLAFRDGDAIELRAKSGKSLARYFPDVVAALRGLTPERFVVDGEIAIPIGDSLSFEALQLRLHPAASRVTKLAAETPAIFILFDCLETPDSIRMVESSLFERRTALDAFFESLRGGSAIRLSPFTRSRRTAQAWLDSAGGALDGVIAKHLDEPYSPGERAMLKVKRLRTADCVVGGFRYASDSHEVGSLLLGLYNDHGKLDHVGFTATIYDRERRELTRKLEALIAPPGFTGKAPGGPSRWSTERTGAWQPLKPELVVEVRYDHVTDDRFRHGAKLIRWRPDKAPRQCTFEQIARPERPSKMIRRLVDA